MKKEQEDKQEKLSPTEIIDQLFQKHFINFENNPYKNKEGSIIWEQAKVNFNEDVKKSGITGDDFMSWINIDRTSDWVS